jgi:hypothetical protein
LNAGLRQALEPSVQEIESLNERIQEYDRRIAKMAKEEYPETALLKQVKFLSVRRFFDYAGPSDRSRLSQVGFSTYVFHLLAAIGRRDT